MNICQADDDCCNNCEEVREAYRRKGWALTNPDLIDQVGSGILLSVDFCKSDVCELEKLQTHELLTKCMNRL